MQLTQSINTILLSLLVLVECIIHAHLLSVPDPDPGIIGPKIFDVNGGWTVVTSNPLTSEVKPIPPINEHWKDANTIIFVTIPHYRDPRCATTVKNLLTKAKHSHRLRFGIIQQRHTEEDFFKCVDDVTTDLQGKKDRQGNPLLGEHQLRLIEFTHQQASGPNFARSFAKQLLQEEDEFCLSIDAHSDVAQDWDDDLMKMWAATDNEFAVLSTQPPDIKQLSEGSQGKVPHLCQATVDKSGKVVNLPPTIATDLIRPILAPLYSEAFSFSKCHAMRKVPNDPFMEIFYDGDEFAKFLRLWTKGYDIYTPNKAVVFHDYHNKLPVIRATNKEISPMEWNMHSPGRKDQMRALYDRTIERLDHLYGASFLTESNAFEDDDTVIEEILKLHRYGTLTTPAVDLMPADEVPKDAIILKRDLFDFMKFTGVNTMKREVFADRCRDLEWIPSYSPSASSVAVKKIDPWVDEMNVFGSNAAERLSVSQSHVPFPVSSNGGEVKLAFYGLEDFTRLPVFASSSEEKVADNPKVVVDHAEVLTNAHESHKVVAAKILPTLDAHRGGELWYIFQWLDSTVEQTINQIDLEMGYGHGHKVMRVFLVFFPLVCLLIGLAIYLLMPSDRRAQYFSYSDDGDSYKVK